jgi:Tfp pilus assembly protein PilP
MKYIIAAIALVVSLAVAVTIVLTYRKSKVNLDTNVTANANAEVEVLPQIERDRSGEYEGNDPFVENILDGAKLTGIYEIYGYKSATLQTTRKSYTLREGDALGDSDWVVKEITNKSITLVSGDKEKTFSK